MPYAVCSLLPNTHKESTFLEIYFMGNGELKISLYVCPHTFGRFVNDLRELLHSVVP